MVQSGSDSRRGAAARVVVRLALAGCAIAIGFAIWNARGSALSREVARLFGPRGPRVGYKPRKKLDSSGFLANQAALKPWTPTASLSEIRNAWHDSASRGITAIDRQLRLPQSNAEMKVALILTKATLYSYEGNSRRAYDVLSEGRDFADKHQEAAKEWLYTAIFMQGVAGLRIGEDENCIMCRGESSCILPINTAARHAKPRGSRLAIDRFTEYLAQFPDDLDARWLLNLAHMTLGEYPENVDPRYLVRLEKFWNSEFDIGTFRDIGHVVGVNRFNQSGGAVMDDFDGDGLLDIVTTSWDPEAPVAFFRNTGDGKFEDRAAAAGLSDQLGGLNLIHGDYDNDGDLDLYVIRGAWLPPERRVRPSLLRNDGTGRFSDVTESAGMLRGLCSNAAQWADYDNDGWLDLFVCAENGPNLLYHNQRNGSFTEVADKAGVAGNGQTFCKGVAWIDFDNDDDQDLFLNNLTGFGQLFANNGDGTFTNVSISQGVDGPEKGFSCWAWDYDNDGWLDIFATSYDRSISAVIKGLMGEPHDRKRGALYHNLGGGGFEDLVKEAGLDKVFATMGSNFADFDNDGFLDIYLGTGEPDIDLLVPNRMFKNVGGRRFADITTSSGTGHLQKGHGVACGDWDRDGNVDLFVETGGATPGDRYHNVLFQNPGQVNRSITVKLIGKQSNRFGVGARIKVVTAGDSPQTVHRHVSSGSSFGANPLEQTIGIGRADRVATLVVHWPTSGTTQVFRDLAAGQIVTVTEFSDQPALSRAKPIRAPRAE